jgi:hypothetical protein
MKQRDGERIQNLNIDETGTLIDLSTSGVAMLLLAPKEKDRELIVGINEMKIKAKVIYSIPSKDEKFRVGLHFLMLTSEKQVTLSDLIDKFSKGIPLKCVLEDAQSKA